MSFRHGDASSGAPIAPAPGRRTFLSAEWRDLAMLNFAAEPKLLAPLVPAGTELDAFAGTTYLSVVGFRFLNTRVFGFGFPFHRNFEEVNLRFYVRRRAAEGWRRGVVFVRELVPRRAIASIARLFYGEPYLAVPMRHNIAPKSDGGLRVQYEWRRGAQWESLSAEADGSAHEIADGSEEEFIAEHYWGYTGRRGLCTEYEVEHPRWRIRRAATCSFQADVASLYGEAFVEPLSARPRSAFIAEGSSVLVRSKSRLALAVT